jgi:hypothetical protein
VGSEITMDPRGYLVKVGLIVRGSP